jgi:hypothetical protein
MPRTPLTPDQLAEKFLLPPGIIRLAIDCGLEAPEGKLTAIGFCRWLCIHYNDFREPAGLPALERPTDSMTEEWREFLTFCNVLRTLTDYFASRTTSLEYKEECMNISNAYGLCSKGFESR